MSLSNVDDGLTKPHWVILKVPEAQVARLTKQSTVLIPGVAVVYLWIIHVVITGCTLTSLTYQHHLKGFRTNLVVTLTHVFRLADFAISAC